MNVDQEQHGATPYLTSTRDTPPPLVTTKFTVKDDGKDKSWVVTKHCARQVVILNRSCCVHCLSIVPLLHGFVRVYSIIVVSA